MIKEQLEIKGHKVDVLASSPDQKTLLYMGKSPIKIKSLRPIIKRLMANNIDEKLSSLIKETEMERYSLEFTAASLDLNQYNVIHAQDVISARALARVKPLCIPLILTMHGSLPEEFIFAEK